MAVLLRCSVWERTVAHSRVVGASCIALERSTSDGGVEVAGGGGAQERVSAARCIPVALGVEHECAFAESSVGATSSIESKPRDP
jgi:hypothetical protein